MNEEKFNDYSNKMFNKIKNKLGKDREEFLFFCLLVEKLGKEINKREILENVLDEIEKYIEVNEYEYVYLDCKLRETQVYTDLEEIIKKGKEE